MLEYDIAEILDVREVPRFLKMMQEVFETQIGEKRFFRISGTPTDLGRVSADLEGNGLHKLLEEPPNPHGRYSGWVVKPLRPLRRTSLGFENISVEYHHMKFIKNGHLEFWTAIDDSFCWQQDTKERNEHPRFYPYPVVEYPVSFLRQYRVLADSLGIDCEITFQMQYVNVKGAILLPYQPESIGFMHPMEPITPLERNRLVFEPKKFAGNFDPDPCALEIIKDLYYEFGYSREHIPFFDATGQCKL